jgi:hypothetical protein
MKKHHTNADSTLWRHLLNTEIALTQARMNFHASCKDKIAVIQKALQDPAQRGTALRYLFHTKIAERQQVFDTLLELASVGHADIGLCREVILSLPRAWVISTIESRAESLLTEGTDEEYRRLAELYLELDPGLVYRLATRALQHSDPDIREVGEEFIESLKTK